MRMHKRDTTLEEVWVVNRTIVAASTMGLRRPRHAYIRHVIARVAAVSFLL